MATLQVGVPAPDFSARTADGGDQAGEVAGTVRPRVLLPNGQHAGVHRETRALNDSCEDLSACGADVIGVSTQDEGSHDQFRAKLGLKFALAADTGHSIAEAYGVGRTLGILPLVARQSFLVGLDGRIAHVWRKVNPSRHAAEVLGVVRGPSAPPAPVADQTR